MMNKNRRVLIAALSLALGISPVTYAYQAKDENNKDENNIDQLIDQRLSTEMTNEAKQEQLGLAKSKRIEVVARGTTILDQLKVLEKTSEEWQQRLTTLETTDEGKGIAANTLSIETYVALRENKPISQNDIEIIRKKVEAVLTPIKAVGDDSLFVPSKSTIAALQGDEATVNKAMENYERLQAKLNLLLSRSAGQPMKAGSPSLKIALEEYHRAEYEREMVFDQESRQRALELVQKAKRERAEAEAQEEAARIRLKTKEMEAQTEHDRLVRVATSERVKRKFAPFLSSGQFQPGVLSCSYPYRWGRGDREGPISYNMLVKCDALNNVRQFAYYASHKGNDRPRWSKPVSDADWVKMGALLAEFNQYASIWVEQGLLGQ